MKKNTDLFINEHSTKLTSLAKWLSVYLWTKWLWVRVQLQSHFAPASSSEFFYIQATIERGFNLKRVRDMIRTYRQNSLIYFIYKIQNKSLTLFGIKIGWEKNLERTFSDEKPSVTFQYLLYLHKHVQHIAVSYDWGDPIPWCFWSVFGLWVFRSSVIGWDNKIFGKILISK